MGQLLGQLINYLASPVVWAVIALVVSLLLIVLVRRGYTVVWESGPSKITLGRASDAAPPVKQNYDQRLHSQQAKDSEASRMLESASYPPAERIVFQRKVGQLDFKIVNYDIRSADTDVIVSSDNTKLSADGGVARQILASAGEEVRNQMQLLGSRLKLGRGDIAITSGGKLGCAYLVHAITVDKSKIDYASPDLIRSLTRKCLDFATSLGATSVALPVIGSGTGGITPKRGIEIIADEAFRYGAQAVERATTVILYVYDPRDLNEVEFLHGAPSSHVSQHAGLPH